MAFLIKVNKGIYCTLMTSHYSWFISNASEACKKWSGNVEKSWGGNVNNRLKINVLFKKQVSEMKSEYTLL